MVEAGVVALVLAFQGLAALPVVVAQFVVNGAMFLFLFQALPGGGSLPVPELEAVMVVGHNPNMSRFLSLLVSGGISERAVEMKKGSVARVELGPKRAVLQWLVSPRVLKTAYTSTTESVRPKTSKK